MNPFFRFYGPKATTAALVAVLAACAAPTGDVVLEARSQELGNLYRAGGGGVGAPAQVRLGVCHAGDLSECGAAGADRDGILAAAREGRLYFRYPDGSLRRYQP